MLFARSDWLAQNYSPPSKNKMVSHFASVTEAEKFNEAAVPDNTKKATKFGLTVFTGKLFIIFWANWNERYPSEVFCLQHFESSKFFKMKHFMFFRMVSTARRVHNNTAK